MASTIDRNFNLRWQWRRGLHGEVASGCPGGRAWHIQASVRVATLLVAGCLFSFDGESTTHAQAIEMSSEDELIGVLASDSDRGEKAIACKRLAVYGSEKCVPELAKLLADPELSSWARIALEAIPGEAPVISLRSAASQLDGLLLVGAINSLGARQDNSAVELLTEKLKSGSPEVATAAALALGRIGTADASAALIENLGHTAQPVQSAVAEGCILCAERLMEEGNRTAAAEMYDRVRTADLPVPRIVEATRGAILARGEEGIPLLREQLRSENRRMLAVGLQTARELESDTLGAALMEEIAAAPAERAALIVEILGDLGGKADLNSLLTLASKGSKEVRLSAITVLGRVGDQSCVIPLLQVSRESNDLQAAVRASLVALEDEGVNQAILARLPLATGDKVLLLELIGLRQIDASDQLLPFLTDADASVRAAALQALAETLPQQRMQVLMDQVLHPQEVGDLGAAMRALRTAAVRMPDRDACADLLAEGLKKSSGSTRASLLEIAAAVGGPRALALLAQYAKGEDEALRDASTRLLGEWMTIDVAPVLLDLATREPPDRFQVRAMRGYIRVARQFVMPDNERVQMCAQALEAAKNVAEQKLVLEVLQRYPNPGTLKIAIEALKKEAIREEANRVARAIGQKLNDNAEAQQILKEAGLK